MARSLKQEGSRRDELSAGFHPGDGSAAGALRSYYLVAESLANVASSIAPASSRQASLTVVLASSYAR